MRIFIEIPAEKIPGSVLSPQACILSGDPRNRIDRGRKPELCSEADRVSFN